MSTEVKLTDAERDDLTRVIRWHIEAHVSEPDKGYASLAAVNAFSLVERIIAARLATLAPPTVEQIAEILAAHAGYVADDFDIASCFGADDYECGWAMDLVDSGDPRADHDLHVAQQIAALTWFAERRNDGEEGQAGVLPS